MTREQHHTAAATLSPRPMDPAVNADLTRYCARIRHDPRYERDLLDNVRTVDHVVIAGYHAAFAVEPRPATVLTPFSGLDLAQAYAEHLPVMALVRVEHATRVVITNDDGTSRTGWQDDTFGFLPTGISWYLAPTTLDHERRCVIAGGRWRGGGRQGVLSRSVTTHAPGVPTVVDLHDHDPHSGTRWPPP
ncbi:hypothetical protein ACIA8C_09740 [Nocardia sp. NPDC051321]|uniref:hypothetical protein n=1 Tax=Nocardia sp. NPDC051321 TaxID=3364323 RepID=UPI0037B80956